MRELIIEVLFRLEALICIFAHTKYQDIFSLWYQMIYAEYHWMVKITDWMRFNV